MTFLVETLLSVLQLDLKPAHQDHQPVRDCSLFIGGGMGEKLEHFLIFHPPPPPLVELTYVKTSQF